jgi:hypothetical protein
MLLLQFELHGLNMKLLLQLKPCIPGTSIIVHEQPSKSCGEGHLSIRIGRVKSRICRMVTNIGGNLMYSPTE